MKVQLLKNPGLAKLYACCPWVPLQLADIETAYHQAEYSQHGTVLKVGA